MERRNALLITSVIIVAILIGAAIAQIWTSVTIPTQGTISTVGLQVYSDAGLTTELKTINWNDGNPIAPGSSITKTIYVKNNGTTLETLTLTTSAWDPEDATTFITVSWDKQDTSLASGANTKAIITMQVSPSTTDIEDFSFNIILRGTA